MDEDEILARLERAAAKKVRDAGVTASAVAPSSRYLHNMAAWPGGHAIVLFGGEHIKSRKSGKKKYARLNDVWAFSSQTRNWTRLIARGRRILPGRRRYSLRGTVHGR